MTLGELNASHIGRTIKYRAKGQEQSRVVVGVRHYRIEDPANAKQMLRRTSVMLGPTGEGRSSDLGEHIADSADPIVVVGR